MTEIEYILMEFLNLSCLLADSVANDVLKNDRTVSDHTVVCQSRVTRKFAELEEALNIEEGLQ
jgi:hypothetical protein